MLNEIARGYSIRKETLEIESEQHLMKFTQYKGTALKRWSEVPNKIKYPANVDQMLQRSCDISKPNCGYAIVRAWAT